MTLLSAAMGIGALRVKSGWYIVYRGPDNLYSKSKTCVKRPLKKNKTKILMTNGTFVAL